MKTTDRSFWLAVGGNVRRAREAAKLTQRSLAKACDFSRTTLALAESGRIITEPTLRAVARAVGKHPSDFLPEVATTCLDVKHGRRLLARLIAENGPADERRLLRHAYDRGAVLTLADVQTLLRHDWFAHEGEVCRLTNFAYHEYLDPAARRRAS